MIDAIVSSFVAEQKELLALELQADGDPQEEDRAANVLANLEACDVSVGLYGRTIVQLTLWSSGPSSKFKNAMLPAHRFTVGDEVEVRSNDKNHKKRFPGGVVCEVSDTHVAVALFSKSTADSTTKQEGDGDEQDEFGAPPLTLLPRSSVEVNRKLINALTTLEKQGTNHPVAGQVIQAMFHPQDFPPFSASPFQPFNEHLDDSQKEAISFALQPPHQPIALIHGPPGTGKTTTITELIHQAILVHKMKVLVTAPSNVAVDNVLERLVASNDAKPKGRKGYSTSKIRVVRLGHPARLKSAILPYSLEALVQNADGTEIVADVRKELQSHLRILSDPKSHGSEKRAAYRELQSLRKEIRTREEKVVQELISSAQVVLATTVGAANRILDHVDAFDLVVIDEAAQALEASCWIPIFRGKRVVLAGDHCQLPPIIKSKKAEQGGLGRTMFERLIELYNDDRTVGDAKILRMLTVQYRMHEQIANWASEAMYHGNLQTHESVRTRTLSLLEGFRNEDVEEDDIFAKPLVIIDTAGCDMHEIVNAAGSRYNPGEALLVAKHVQRLVGAGLKPEQMCVITPYNGQVECLRDLLISDYPKLEIRSVDGFQGGEREAVILSLVRSSGGGGADGIGFLKDNRRQNVAVTRAKRHLALICDSETVSQSKFIATLIEWIEKNGEQQSAFDYQGSVTADESDLRAEEELMKLVENSTSNQRGSRSQQPAKPLAMQKMGPENRQMLMDKIAAFAGTALPREEMALSSTLTSFDRRLVHEFAEQIGLGHRSEGTEGSDRCIILKKESLIVDPVVATVTELVDESVSVSPFDEVMHTKEKEAADDEDRRPTSTGLSFFALSPDDDSSDDEASSDQDISATEMQVETVIQAGRPISNSLLATLARERAERQKERQPAPPPAPTKKNVKKTTKSKGRQAGVACQPNPTPRMDESIDLDDMAFLEAQIEKSQNAHGRKVVGSGKGYRTIVNGVLNSRPEAKSAPINANAASALQAKLKQAQNDRKAKAPKKKK